jgi:hypothetical protein
MQYFKLIKKIMVFLILAVFISHFAYSDDVFSEALESKEKLFAESGFITGLGNGNIDEGNYQPVLFAWHMGIDLNRFFDATGHSKGRLTFYIEPQVNPVINPETDIECGIGLGFKFMYRLTDRVSPYIMAGAGPHYISVNTKKQANGFLFSDIIGAGFYYFLNGKSAVNIGYRFRHMSSANLSEPNNGIESHFGTIGYSIFF